MTKAEAKAMLKRIQEPEAWEPQINQAAFEALDMAIEALDCSESPNSSDTIGRQAVIDKFIDGLEDIFADLRERHVDDSVCGLCEYDGAYIGQSGDWCNECPGFEKYDCFKLSDKTRKEWTEKIIKALPSARPEVKEISYTDCANAMLMMWIDKVLTDGEYNRIMDKLNAHELKKMVKNG